jgi:hypothetical protein
MTYLQSVPTFWSFELSIYSLKWISINVLTFWSMKLSQGRQGQQGSNNPQRWVDEWIYKQMDKYGYDFGEHFICSIFFLFLG